MSIQKPLISNRGRLRIQKHKTKYQEKNGETNLRKDSRRTKVKSDINNMRIKPFPQLHAKARFAKHLRYFIAYAPRFRVRQDIVYSRQETCEAPQCDDCKPTRPRRRSEADRDYNPEAAKS